MLKRFGRTRPVALAVALLSLSAAVSGTALANGGNSAATITGSFGDSCRDFTAHSSKDVSHVVIVYADGRVVKDESTTTPDFSIDGDAGDEIASATVKSGTTRETFTCSATNAPPTAILEIKTPAECEMFGTPPPRFTCYIATPRINWSRPSDGIVVWAFDDPAQFPASFSFRGTSSTDPDADIVSWSIDFGDGTSTGGNWVTDPPIEVAHSYPCCANESIVSLSVTDAAGQTDTDTMSVRLLNALPD